MEKSQPTTPKRQPKSASKVIFILVVIGAFWLLWTAFGHDGGKNNQSTNTARQTTQASTPPQTPAYTLARLELNHTPDNATVAQYQAALDSLKPLCTEDQSKIANNIYNSLTDLRNHNINDETAITFAAHIVSAIPPSAAPTNCTSVMAGYLILRETPNQQSQ